MGSCEFRESVNVLFLGVGRSSGSIPRSSLTELKFLTRTVQIVSLISNWRWPVIIFSSLRISFFRVMSYFEKNGHGVGMGMLLPIPCSPYRNLSHWQKVDIRPRLQIVEPLTSVLFFWGLHLLLNISIPFCTAHHLGFMIILCRIGGAINKWWELCLPKMASIRSLMPVHGLVEHNLRNDAEPRPNLWKQKHTMRMYLFVSRTLLHFIRNEHQLLNSLNRKPSSRVDYSFPVLNLGP